MSTHCWGHDKDVRIEVNDDNIILVKFEDRFKTITK